jgi:hypothetical protein
LYLVDKFRGHRLLKRQVFNTARGQAWMQLQADYTSTVMHRWSQRTGDKRGMQALEDLFDYPADLLPLAKEVQVTKDWVRPAESDPDTLNPIFKEMQLRAHVRSIAREATRLCLCALAHHVSLRMFSFCCLYRFSCCLPCIVHVL